MTEKDGGKEAIIEVSVSYAGKTLTAHGLHWDEALARIELGLLKARIVELAKDSFAYDRNSDTWLLKLEEENGKAGERIALVLLFHYPRRISRSMLATSSEIKPGSLNTYLSKSKPEISKNIDENDDGVTLNQIGLQWAIDTLNLLKKQ